MSMCRVFSCVVRRGCLLWPVCSLGKTLLAFALLHSVHIPRPNLPVTPGVSWLPIFAFQSPIMKRTSFLGVSSKRSCRSSQNHSTSASSALLVGHRLELLWYWMVCLRNEQRSKNPQTTAQLHLSHTLVKLYSKFSKPGFSNTWTMNFQIFKLVSEKAQEPEIKLPTSAGSSKKQESSRKKHLLLLYWLCQSLWLCGSQ